MTWQYNHVTFLPEDVESHIVCQWTENLDQFPARNLVSLGRRAKGLSLPERILRRFGSWTEERRSLPLLAKVIRSSGASVLHSHFGQCGWAASKLARNFGLRHVVSFYGFDLSFLPKMDARWIGRYQRMSDRVDLVLCEGPHMAECLRKLGVCPQKIKVLRLGIDLPSIPFVPRENTGGGPKRFLIAGSFREKKGIPYALEALGILNRTYPQLEITVIGDSGGGEAGDREKERIMNVVAHYGLAAKTRFLGYQPHQALIREFYRHDILVAPSVTAADGDTEGGAPVTVIEAAASGMPIASTLHCDIPFILSKENRRYLVAERNPTALSAVIERLIKRGSWASLVAANRRLIEEELDVRGQAKKLASIYRGLDVSRACERRRLDSQQARA